VAKRAWAHLRGTRLRHESPGGEYTVGFPDPRENRLGGPVNPTSALPWSSPWRLVVVGSLKTIAESMLGIDLADPPAVKPAGEIVPGKASWSWPLLGDRRTVFDTQKEFVDYAADMGWRYTLVDGFWDTQIGYERIQELIDYAKTKNVRILLWYNSAGPWNTTPQTPRDRMLTHESRVAEFARLKQMGVAGLKIDFFGADGQSMIGYYHDIDRRGALRPAAQLRRHAAARWSRTYPHLMSMRRKGPAFELQRQRRRNRRTPSAVHAQRLRPDGLHAYGAGPPSAHAAEDHGRVGAGAGDRVHFGHHALRRDAGGHGEGARVRARIPPRRAERVG
jgi:hypothetical protein